MLILISYICPFNMATYSTEYNFKDFTCLDIYGSNIM